MSYKAEILADSVSLGDLANPKKIRLVTAEVTFPRFILSEWNTHRDLSRNSASSRAIPPEKQIQRAMEDPFMPETFNSRVKGMGVGDRLDDSGQLRCQQAWIDARDLAIQQARILIDADVDKSRVNRLLEPFMWHTAIVTATEWDNFFALRDHPDAQPEFQIIARMLREEMEESEPWVVKPGEWHLPLTRADFPFEDITIDWMLWAHISSGRCARVSFDTHRKVEDPDKSYERNTTLAGKGHLSPSEHPARPFSDAEWGRVRAAQYAVNESLDMQVPAPTDKDVAAAERYKDRLEFCGNFRGWVQLRKHIPNEHNFGLVEAAHA